MKSLVTGTAQGIGKAIAEEILSQTIVSNSEKWHFSFCVVFHY